MGSRKAIAGGELCVLPPEDSVIMKPTTKLLLKECKEWLWQRFQILRLIFGFIVVPGLFYLFITQWDPTKGREESSLGIYLTLVLYWVALYLIIKYRKETKERKRQLKRLLDGAMNEKEISWLKNELREQPHFVDDNDTARWGY
jgi:hypothetical protein